MRLFPPVSVKRNLADLSAGELIGFRHGSESRFALVGEHNDKAHPPDKWLFLFAPANDGRSEPFYLLPKWGPTTYLSYGTAYFIEADYAPEAVDYNPFQREEPNGVLLVFGDSTLLEARSMPHTGSYGTAYYDIETHEVVERPGSSTTVGLRHWSLYLGTPEQRRTCDKPLISVNAVRQAT